MQEAFDELGRAWDDFKAALLRAVEADARPLRALLDWLAARLNRWT